MSIQVQPLYLASVVILWLLAYHFTYWLVAIARDPSLVCWSVGLFGVTGVSLREPTARRVISQLAIAALVVAAIVYACLYLLMPPPISGLSRSLQSVATVVSLPALILTIARVAAILRERRYPLWGEARVMTGVQRSLATGSRVYFTAVGRAFLRDRFDATPHEFLRMVRY